MQRVSRTVGWGRYGPYRRLESSAFELMRMKKIYVVCSAGEGADTSTPMDVSVQSKRQESLKEFTSIGNINT